MTMMKVFVSLVGSAVVLVALLGTSLLLSDGTNNLSWFSKSKEDVSMGLRHDVYHRELRLGHFDGLFDDEKAAENKRRVAEYRYKYVQTCRSTDSSTEDLLDSLRSIYEPSSVDIALHQEQNLPVEPCDFTLLDFGANIGDSLGKFIDGGIDICTDKGMERQPKYNLDEGKVTETHKPGKNKMIDFGKCFRMKEQCVGEYVRYPEDYCYFGIEGNPVFTERLQKLQQRVMRSSPRPVRRAHFFTEHVGTSQDGPTVLYLDTVNKAQNYWGSSIITTHIDVQKSVDEGRKVETPVTGISMATLVKQTVNPKPGAQLLIKMDIEGAEYPLLNAAADSGIFCEYIQQGVKVAMIIEVHPPKIIGNTPDYQRFQSETQEKLKNCGVDMWPTLDAGR